MIMTMIRGESGRKDRYYSPAFSKLCFAEHWCSVKCEKVFRKNIEKQKQSWTDRLLRNVGKEFTLNAA
jgi:hypothetical protein